VKTVSDRPLINKCANTTRGKIEITCRPI